MKLSVKKWVSGGLAAILISTSVFLDSGEALAAITQPDVNPVTEVYLSNGITTTVQTGLSTGNANGIPYVVNKISVGGTVNFDRGAKSATDLIALEELGGLETYSGTPAVASRATYFPKGIWINGSTALDGMISIAYTLNQKYSRFKAIVGPDAYTYTNKDLPTKLQFQVLGDNDIVLWDSNTQVPEGMNTKADGTAKNLNIDIDISNVNKLTLRMTSLEIKSKDGNWAMARVVKKSDTAAEVADTVVSMENPVEGATSLKLPSVPTGYTIAIKSSDKPDVIHTDGSIKPANTITNVNLILTVTKESDGTQADTANITVNVPADRTAQVVADGIKSVSQPIRGQTILPLPVVPEGFTIKILTSSNEAVIPLDSQIFPVFDTTTNVTLVYEVTHVASGSKANTAQILVTVPPLPDVVVVDKSNLLRVLDTARSTYANSQEGTEIGQYPAGSRSALQAAITSAETLYANTSTTQAQVDSETTDLNQALSSFLALVVRDPSLSLKTLQLTTDKSTLNLDGKAVLQLSGTLENGSPADMSQATIQYSTSNSNVISSITKLESGAAEARGGTKLTSAGQAVVTATVTLNGTTKMATVDLTVLFKADRQSVHPYNQTLVTKMFMAANNGNVSLNFEQGMEVIKKADQLTRGIPKIVYLVGWQFNGHDTGYPALNVVNPKLKRPQDEKAEDSLIWLMKEARKYNTTVSLHINMLDAADSSPLWQTYLDHDVIAKELDGSLRTYVWGYPISYTREWDEGLTTQRIDQLLELLPISEAGTIHIDALHQNIPNKEAGFISPYHGITSQQEAETVKKVIRYWNSKGVDVTSEFDKNYRVDPLIGLQPMAWHVRFSASEQLKVPSSLYVGGDSGDVRFGQSMLGEGRIKVDPNNLTGYLGDFALNTLPWYYLNRLERLSDSGGVVTFSNNVTSSNVSSVPVIKQGDRFLRQGNDVFIPVLWNENIKKEIIAYSGNGYTNKTWVLPDDWTGTQAVDVYAIGLNGLDLIESKSVTNNSVNLSLEAGQGVSIFSATLPAITPEEVASAIKAIQAPKEGDSYLTLPKVPAGFGISIKSSDKPDVIGLDGKITPQPTVTTVNLVLSVKRLYDNLAVDTTVNGLPVIVPAIVPTTNLIPNVSMSSRSVSFYGTNVLLLQTQLSNPTWTVKNVDGTATTTAKVNSRGQISFTDNGTYIVNAQSGSSEEKLTVKINAIENLTNLTLNGNGNGVAFGSIAGGNYPPTNVFDGNLTTFYEHNNSEAYVGWDFGSAKVINMLKFYPRNNQLSRIKDAKFQGSNSLSGNYVDLYVNIEQPASTEWITLAFDNQTAYRYYRWMGADTTRANVADLQMYTNMVKTLQYTPGGTERVAEDIDFILSPEANAILLTLPAVPEGFTVAIKSSDKPSIISTNGTINVPSKNTAVQLVLSVTNTVDGTTAYTEPLLVNVPAVPGVYVITANAGSNGTISPSGSITVSEGDNANFLLTPDVNYEIDQITVDDEVTTVTGATYVFMNIMRNHSISVTFKEQTEPVTTYSIAASAGEHGTISPSGSISVREGDNAIFLLTPDTNYEVDQITVDDEAVSVTGATYEFKNVTRNHSISVTFKGQREPVTTYTIVASAGNHGTISPSGSISVTEGDNASFMITPDTGYEVNKVTVDGHKVTVSGGMYVFTNVTGNHTMSVTFKLSEQGSDNGNNGNNGSTGNGDNGNNGTVSPVTNPDSYVVKPGDISNPSSNGIIIIQVPDKFKQVELPVNLTDLIGNNPLEIQMGQWTLTVPSKLLQELKNELKQEELPGSRIILNAVPLTSSESQVLLDKGSASSNAKLKVSGTVINFSLSIVTSDGKAISLTKFDEPLTIRIKVDPSMNLKLTAIYYITDDGTLEYIGGRYENGEMVAEIHHFSKYAVIEFRKTFIDVPSQHWAEDAIQQLASKNIINGTSETTFEPMRTVTRAEFTAMLVKALNLTAQGDRVFADVASGAWYTDVVSKAVNAGIVKGKSEGLFDPNGQITREEMVTMIMRAYAVIYGTSNHGTENWFFKDEAKISSWAMEYVRAAAALQLISGREPGRFVPDGISTRAEAAILVNRLLQN
ncbi:hypothetical protein EJP82_20235 [Paenibacillus anaericanus]|uniref:SLH domain-containing protein n=1 Tax=Paenibacillus anaericanus TaxID=170367 RepID=A0A433Y4L3_9BACL|nr:S-layer homology domain-containing protein [Paenibacillus anaericanus]RUT43290.1 hypothetical protein EJP82_20235 [Paenibacillus anaericanus]